MVVRRSVKNPLAFQQGDVGYVRQTLPHYIENTGTENLIFLEMFKSSQYQDVSLNQGLTHLPPALVQAHLNIDLATINAIPPLRRNYSSAKF